MGVYVADMDMPTKCSGCPFIESFGVRCGRTGKFLDRDDYRHERDCDCPLVEVSTPHGRLIDADTLMDDIKRDAEKAIKEDDKVGSFWLGHSAGFVIKKSTILEAEE